MSTPTRSRGFTGIVSLLFAALTGLYLTIGGAWLLALGGSAAIDSAPCR